MAKTPTQVVFDQWDGYVREFDDGPVFIGFDVEAAQDDLTDTLTSCARVMIPIHHPNQNGGPVSPESEHLYALEDELCQGLADHGVCCRLVGRVTHAGVRQLVFQLEDWECFRPPVGLWIMAHEDYEIDVAEAEGWDFFDDVIRPSEETWLYLADSSVVRGLIDAGSDPEKAHALEFVFCGSQRGLRRLAGALASRGYTALPSNDFASGTIVMVKPMTLDADAIFQASLAHRDLAAELGVEYDGWGAEVVK